MAKAPRAPHGLGKAGSVLWSAVTEEYELEPHEQRLLLEMARTVDQLDALAVVVAREGVMDPQSGRAHPALAEARQQRIAYARLSAALRLPTGEEGDQASGRRPQRRVGARGVYAIRPVS